eukprot:scaffold33956_cov29-Tisochrysis_lutea.AAC.7
MDVRIARNSALIRSHSCSSTHTHGGNTEPQSCGSTGSPSSFNGCASSTLAPTPNACESSVMFMCESSKGASSTSTGISELPSSPSGRTAGAIGTSEAARIKCAGALMLRRGARLRSSLTGGSGFGTRAKRSSIIFLARS